MGLATKEFDLAKIRLFDVRRNDAGMFVRIGVTTGLNPTLAAGMTPPWEGLYDHEGRLTGGWDGMGLLGSITNIKFFDLTPEGLEGAAIQLPADSAEDFSV